MYKTIRHGENSLQYTILPQNDDFRVENAKLNIANSTKGKYKNKNEKRKSIFAYFGLLFICTVIIGAILIPFLVSTQCLPNPTDWFTKNKSLPNMKVDDDYRVNNSISSKKDSSSSILSKTLLEPSKFSQISNNGFLQKDDLNRKPVDVQYPKKTGDEYNFMKYSKQQNNPTSNVGNIISQKNLIDKDEIRNLKVIEAINEYKKTERENSDTKSNFYESGRNANENIFEKIQSAGELQMMKKVSLFKTRPVVKANNKNDEQFYLPEINLTEHLTTLTPFSIKVSVQPYLRNKEVPALNLTKKPIILPILAQTSKILKNNGNVNEQGKSENWIKSHWPFIDPSTYFQWTGYKTEDSIILPAILGAALVSIILFASLCLITRKKTSKSKGRKRSRIVKTEESGDDNATLLTTSNLSDDE